MATLDDKQVAKFIKAARGERLEALFILAVTTGLRQGEILGLRWKDIDFERRQLHVRFSLQGTKRENITLGSPKTKAGERTVPLGSLAIDALHAHRERQDAERDLVGSKWNVPEIVADELTELVFSSPFGNYLSTGTLNDVFHRVVERAGVNGRSLRFHDLRHTAITAWLHDPAIGPKNVQAMAGHQSITTTFDIYGHVLTDSQRAGADKRDERLLELMVGDRAC